MTKRRVTYPVAIAIATAAAFAGATASASSTAVIVPNEHCVRLDVADNAVSARGLHYINRGGGLFGIIVRSDWVVSTQTPKGGTKVKRSSNVYLYAARSC
jgi:hypothetical protein